MISATQRRGPRTSLQNVSRDRMTITSLARKNAPKKRYAFTANMQVSKYAESRKGERLERVHVKSQAGSEITTVKEEARKWRGPGRSFG